MQAVSEANLQAQATWNNRACGLRDEDVANQFDGVLSDKYFYNTLRLRRYGGDDPWVVDVLDFPSMKDRDVLEIGHGMGCDIATAARNGARAHAIDLTPNHHDIALRTLENAGVSAELRLGNAGELPFDSASMDVVYSLGVLHHTDNTEQCIAEVHRVLRPGGMFVMAMYNFWSLPHLSLLVRGVLTGRLFRLGYRNLLSTVEAGADGEKIAPLVKLYTKSSVKRLLADFSSVEVSVHGSASRRLTGRLGYWASRRIGWYVVAHAKK